MIKLGKSGMFKSLGITKNERVKRAIEKIKNAGKMEDDDTIMVPINNQKTKWEITPKKMSAKEYHLQLTKRLIEKKQQDLIICYLNKDGDKVIMEMKAF